MNHHQIDNELVESIIAKLKEEGYDLSPEEVAIIVDLIKEKALFHYIDQIIHQADAILDINPSLTEKEILEEGGEDADVGFADDSIVVSRHFHNLETGQEGRLPAEARPHVRVDAVRLAGPEKRDPACVGTRLVSV